jgi:hypothetical protein
MRTIKLTHEQIGTILRALGIAENSFYEARKNYISQLVNVRGVDKEATKETDVMLKKENEFCDLLFSIKNGDLDA